MAKVIRTTADTAHGNGDDVAAVAATAVTVADSHGGTLALSPAAYT